MKLNLIALACLTLLTFILCSCSNPMEDSTKGETAAKKILTDLGVAWKSSSIEESLSPELKKSRKDLDSVLDVYAECFGPIKTIENSKTVNGSMGVGDRPEFLGTYQYDVSFEKAKGKASITVYKKESKWYLSTLNIVSDVLKTYKSEDRKSALDAGEKIAIAVFTDWKSEYIEEHASDEFKKALQGGDLGNKVNKMGINAIFAGEKLKYGKFVKVLEKKSGNFTKLNGNDAIQTFYQVECEKGKCDFNLNLVKSDAHWKILGINFHSVK